MFRFTSFRSSTSAQSDHTSDQSGFLNLAGFAVSQCAVCRSWPSHPVCVACCVRFTPVTRRCRRCGLQLPPDLSGGSRFLPLECLPCEKHPPPVDLTCIAVSYAFPWSGLISQFKFSEHVGWASVFAALMLQTDGIRQCLAGLSAHDVLIPLPLSNQRLETRGFNQAWTLTQHLARRSETLAHTSTHLLLRIRDTAPQSTLPLSDRLTNVDGAFAVDPLQVHRLEGRRVVLVDDVMTSGASLYAAAQSLRAAGAAHITLMVLARTEM